MKPVYLLGGAAALVGLALVLSSKKSPAKQETSPLTPLPPSKEGTPIYGGVARVGDMISWNASETMTYGTATDFPAWIQIAVDTPGALLWGEVGGPTPRGNLYVTAKSYRFPDGTEGVADGEEAVVAVNPKDVTTSTVHV